MMQQTKSASSAMPSRHMIDRPARGRAATRIPKYSALPRSSIGHPRPSTADVAACPVHPADAAQAGLFEGILQAEIAELRQLAMVMVARWAETNGNANRPAKPLTELTASIEELHRLLKALRNRFPPGPWLSEPA
jgi:hypothetical protein